MSFICDQTRSVTKLIRPGDETTEP